MSDEQKVAPVIQWAQDTFEDSVHHDICLSEKTFDLLVEAIKHAPDGRYSAGYREVGELWWLWPLHDEGRIDVVIGEDDSLEFFRGREKYVASFVDEVPDVVHAWPGENLEVLEPLKCETCGVTDETVSEGLDPFALEISAVEVPMTLCKKCYQDRMDDI